MTFSKLEMDVLSSSWSFISDLNERDRNNPYILELREGVSAEIVFSILKENRIGRTGKMDNYVSCSIPQDTTSSKKILIEKKKIVYPATLRPRENKIALPYLNYLFKHVPGMVGETTLIGFDE